MSVVHMSGVLNGFHDGKDRNYLVCPITNNIEIYDSGKYMGFLKTEEGIEAEIKNLHKQKTFFGTERNRAIANCIDKLTEYLSISDDYI